MGIRFTGAECLQCHRTCSFNEGEPQLCERCKANQVIDLTLYAKEIEFGFFDFLRLRNHDDVDVTLLSSDRKEDHLIVKIQIPTKQEKRLLEILGSRVEIEKDMAKYHQPARSPSGKFFVTGLCNYPVAMSGVGFLR